MICFGRLYYLPIIYAAYFFGLRGGFATAFLVSLLYLPFIAFRISNAAEQFDQSLEIVLFYLVAILTGLLSQRQKKAMQRLEKLTLGIIQSLVTAIEARDPYTKGHSVRVMYIATLLGKRMKLSRWDERSLRIGALLHDVGKIGVDLHVLNKPASLTETETNVMHKHPEWGVHILGSIEELEPILPAILYHHEKFNGSGYPKGLTQTEIPLLARIVSVADTFDAMTTDRPYKEARSFPEALEEIKGLSGGDLDPEIVAILASEEVQRELSPEKLEEGTIHLEFSQDGRDYAR